MKQTFQSAWAEELAGFLVFKRSLGYPYQRAEYTLRELDRFLLKKVVKKSQPLDQLVLAWLASKPPRQAVSVSIEVGVLRQFFTYLHRLPGQATLREPLWPRLPTESSFVPYYLSEQDIRKLLALCPTLQRPAFRAILYRTLLLVLYCTGLRFGEALRLRLQDVDLRTNTFWIDTFKGRARWVPFHPSLRGELNTYQGVRSQYATSQENEPFFVRADGRALPYKAAASTLCQLFRQAGLKPSSGGGARPYDLRHAFAVHRLSQWYRQGVDLHAHLPWLSAYMGHVDLVGTESYLHITPELLERAGGPAPAPLSTARSAGKDCGMKQAPADLLLKLTETFFQQYLRRTRGASAHTVRAYRDTLKLFFLFLAERQRCRIADLGLDALQAEAVLAFLDHLESQRGNSAVTRNIRLAALHSFVQHLLRSDVTRAGQYGRILAIPAKRAPHRVVPYLEPEEVKQVIATVDSKSARGERDRALLLFLYNTGARVSEALAVRPPDLRLDRPRQVRLWGKGRKERLCPLWPETASALQPLLNQGTPEELLFKNAQGRPLTRDGVAYVLAQYVEKAAAAMPQLKTKRVTPHVLRHSCAVALLQAGVDVSVIRDYLGHTSVATTSRYITTNLQTKREVLEAFWNRAGLTKHSRSPRILSPKLLAFLEAL